MLSLWKKLFHTGLIIVLLMVLIVSHQTARADDVDDIQKQIDDLQHQMELSVKATTPLESEVSKLGKQVSGIQTQIKQAGAQIEELSLGIKERDKQIASQ
ncbi:MAG: hypothetical protein WCG44_01320, partial [bacterium]